LLLPAEIPRKIEGCHESYSCEAGAATQELTPQGAFNHYGLQSNRHVHGAAYSVKAAASRRTPKGTARCSKRSTWRWRG